MPVLAQYTLRATQPGHPSQVLVWRIAEPEHYFDESSRGYALGPAEATALADVTHPQKRLEWLAARHAARLLMPPGMVVAIVNDEYGRPIVQGAVGDMGHVSLSHTEGLAAAMYSPALAVGVDIERLGQPRNFESRRLFMNAQELKVFASHPAESTFLAIWSAKECIYKIFSHRERGLSFRNHMHVQFLNGALVTSTQTDVLDLSCTLNSPAHRAELLVQCRFTADYILAYTTYDLGSL